MDAIFEYIIYPEQQYFEVEMAGFAHVLSLHAADPFPKYALTIQANSSDPKQVWCFVMLTPGDQLPEGATFVAVVDDYFGTKSFLYRVPSKPVLTLTPFQIA